MEKSNFTALMDRFYDSGLMKKVYETDNALVCNVFDQFYMAFSSDIVKRYEEKGMFPGFIMNTEGLRQIVADDSFATTYYGLLPPEKQETALRFVDENLYSSLLRKKDALSQRPPQPNMDLEFEQQVIAMQNSKGELASMLAEQQAQSLATAQQKGVPSQK